MMGAQHSQLDMLEVRGTHERGVLPDVIVARGVYAND